MATYTPNLNLKKPLTGEPYDVISVHNDAMDKLDIAVGNNTSLLSEKAKDIDLAVERARITNLATLAVGSTTGDAELIDARTDDMGYINANAGSAVRGIAKKKMSVFVEELKQIQTGITVLASGTFASLVTPAVKLKGTKYLIVLEIKNQNKATYSMTIRPGTANGARTAISAYVGSTKTIASGYYNGIDTLFFNSITVVAGTVDGFAITAGGTMNFTGDINAYCYDVSDLTDIEITALKVKEMWNGGGLLGFPKNQKLLNLVLKNLDEINLLKPEITASKIIAAFGDSLTRGNGATTVGGWVTLLNAQLASDLYTYTLINQGVSGDSAQNVVNRMGALPIYLKPFTLPARAGANISVPIEFYDNVMGEVDFQSAPTGLGSFPKLNGVKYGFINGTSATSYTLVRQFDGPEIVFTKPVLVLPDGPNIDNITIAWMGTNNIGSTGEELIQYQKYVEDFLNTSKYLIVGLTADTYHADINAKNSAMSKYWGKRFVDVKKYLIEFGLSDNGLTPTTTDLENIANNIIPRALLTVDQVHFNEYGYVAIKNCMYQKLKDMNYITK